MAVFYAYAVFQVLDRSDLNEGKSGSAGKITGKNNYYILTLKVMRPGKIFKSNMNELVYCISLFLKTRIYAIRKSQFSHSPFRITLGKYHVESPE